MPLILIIIDAMIFIIIVMFPQTNRKNAPRIFVITIFNIINLNIVINIAFLVCVMFSPTNRKYFPKVPTNPTDVPGGLTKIKKMGSHGMTNKRTETKTCTQYTYKDKDK